MNKNIGIGIGAIVVIAVIALTLSGGGSSQAQQLLNDAISKQGDLNSASYKGEFTVSISEDGESQGSVLVSMLGDSDNLQNPEETRSQLSISFTDQGLLTLGEGENMEIKISLKSFGQTIYIRLDSFPEGALPFDLSKISNQWIKAEDLDQQAQALTGESASVSPGAGQLNEEQLNEIKDLARDANILEVTKDLGIEDGHYHLAYKVNSKNFLKFMRQVFEIVSQEEEISEDEMRQIESAFDQIYGQMKAEGEIWIDENSTQITKATFDANIPSAEDLPIDININGEFEILNLNEEMQIDEPEESISFEEAFGIVLQGAFDLGPAPTQVQ